MRQLRVEFAFVILLGSIALAQTNPVPIVYQPLIPMTVKPASKGFTLTVNGTGFATDALVLWNGSTRITNYISSSQLQIQVTAADVAKPATATVSVSNPGPGGGISNPVFFPIQTPTPSVVVFPASGFSGSGVNVAGDFNNDGFLDLVVGGDLLIDFYAGNGDGTFAAAVPKLSEVPIASLLGRDFNADGNLDLAALDGIGNTVVFISGHVKAQFVQQQIFRSWNDSVVTADFNADGKLDLVITGWKSAIHLGNGDGTFGGPLFIGSNFYLGTPAVGDFDGDGKLDLAIPDPGSRGVHVLLGNGDGTFRNDVLYPTQFAGWSVVAADINGDGRLDLVTNGVSVLLGNGDGTFTNGGGVGATPNRGPLNIADFNGDGKLDLAFPASPNGVTGIYLLLGNGDGTFQNPILLANDNSSGVVIGDFNGDGKLDIVGKVLYLQVPLNLSPSSLDFGNQKVGTKTSPQTVTAINDGSAALTIANVGFSGNDPQDFSQTNDCGSSIPVGSHCHIQIVFQPQAGGARSANLSVSYQGFGSPQTVSLTGFGVVATVTLTPSKMKFPVQLAGTTSSAQIATLMNTGTVAVNISNISTTAQFTQTNNCPSSLPVSGNCQIKVEFAPQQKGQIAGTLSVTDDAQGSPQTAKLSGTGTVVKLSTAGVNFGNQKVGTKSPPAPVKLTNVGKSSLIIHQIAIKGINTGDFSQTNNCGSKVLAGGSCTIKVTFAPQAKGERSASLQISDDGGGSPQKVALTGNGT
jgi:hypothetical protein